MRLHISLNCCFGTPKRKNRLFLYCILNIWMNLNTAFIIIRPIFSQRVCKGSLLSASSPVLADTFLSNSHSHWCEIISYSCSDLFFPNYMIKTNPFWCVSLLFVFFWRRIKVVCHYQSSWFCFLGVLQS